MEVSRILIVDDEELARSRIQRFLQELNAKLVIKSAQNGLEALAQIKEFNPELVFLDIQMPGLNGFEILQQIESRSFKVVFQTAYDEFAVNAFEENACDYLLKPFTQDRFEKAYRKAEQMIQNEKSLQKLDSALKSKNLFLKNIVVKSRGQTIILNVSEIECFTSEDHCTVIWSGGREYISDLSLSWLSEQLDSIQFFRAHRSNIVSLAQIQTIGSSEDSDLVLKSGRKLPLSRRCRKELLQKLNIDN